MTILSRAKKFLLNRLNNEEIKKVISNNSNINIQDNDIDFYISLGNGSIDSIVKLHKYESKTLYKKICNFIKNIKEIYLKECNLLTNEFLSGNYKENSYYKPKKVIKRIIIHFIIKKC